MYGLITTFMWAFAIALYAMATLGLMVYGLNCYLMVGLCMRRRRHARDAWQWAQAFGQSDTRRHQLPQVTTQIVMYNEINVAERGIRAVCALDYPASRHEIQVLDDSTDDTTSVAQAVVDELAKAGHDITLIHRTHRAGFKAGALAEGLQRAKGELIAVFDADFVPPREFLQTLVPFFVEDPALGLAQARWGHLNRRQSLLTRVQAVGIDGHFLVEQVARCWNRLFMNFNGTAGIWRRAAIEAAGGWHWDTLTEDLDLSYRVQFAGWNTKFVPDLVVPGELPDTIGAFRNQQFRWAKGSIQTLIKLGGRLWRSEVSLFKKCQATLHMGGYLVHPLMFILSMLALPMLTITPPPSPATGWSGLLVCPLTLAMAGPSTLCMAGQAFGHARWMHRLLLLPAMVVFGVGLALSNTKAILEAVIGRESEFVRTPKRGSREVRRYAVRFPPIALCELAMGVYALGTVVAYWQADRFSSALFLLLYALGYLLIGGVSAVEAVAPADRASGKVLVPETQPVI